MATVKRANKITLTLDETQIQRVFEMLDLRTPADREKFLRLERMSKEIDPRQDHLDDALRVRLGDSTTFKRPTNKL